MDWDGYMKFVLVDSDDLEIFSFGTDLKSKHFSITFYPKILEITLISSLNLLTFFSSNPTFKSITGKPKYQ